MGDSRRDDAIGGPDRDLVEPIIPGDELRSICRSYGFVVDGHAWNFARRIEQEVLHRMREADIQKSSLHSGVAMPLADYEGAFINNVRTVIAGIRESIAQEERERIARELPAWLRKGPGSGGTA